jgi:hypothetical protein
VPINIPKMTNRPTTEEIRKHADELRKVGVEEARVLHYLDMMAADRCGLAHKIIYKKICSARRRRDAGPCLAAPLENGRCKWHGGMSTGAKTPEGKARQLEGLRRHYERQRWLKEQAKSAYTQIFDD